MVETGWRPYPREAICSPRDLYFHATVFFVDDLIVCKDHPERNRVQALCFCKDSKAMGQEPKAGRRSACRMERAISLVSTLSETISSAESSISPQNSPHSLVLSVTKL